VLYGCFYFQMPIILRRTVTAIILIHLVSHFSMVRCGPSCEIKQNDRRTDIICLFDVNIKTSKADIAVYRYPLNKQIDSQTSKYNVSYTKHKFSDMQKSGFKLDCR
jgi:hypothetical protein